MRFSKWHALGNDYLLVERAELGGELDDAIVRRLCDRHFGVGADGVVEVVGAAGADADVAIWNPDGSRAEFSGNGARIAARWLAVRENAEHVRLTVGPRAVAATMEGGDVRLEVGRVDVGDPEELIAGGELLAFVPVSVENPHAVVRRDYVEEDVLRLGPLVERHRRFPAGTNVQLVRVLGRRGLEIGIWERGAGRTLSSGSSAVAAAAAALAEGWCESPVTVAAGAGDLRVALEPAGPRTFRAELTGPAEEVFRGELVEQTWGRRPDGRP